MTRTLRSILLAVLFVLPAVAHAGQYRWTQESPEPPRLDAILPDPSAIGEAWILAGGTVYRAFESNEPWRPLRQSVHSLWRHSSTGRLYALESTGLATSYDGGVTWISRTLPDHGCGLTISGEAVPKVYCASGSRIFRSTNDGENWIQVFREQDDMPLRQISAVSSSLPVVYALAYGAQFVCYRSADGGETWERRGGFPIYPFPIIGFYVHLLEASPHDPNLVFATSPFIGMYRSTDGGASWGLLQGAETYYATVLVFDPIDSQRIVIGRAGGPTFMESRNFGTTWSPLRTGLPFEDSAVSTLNLGTDGVIHAGLGRGGSGLRVKGGGRGAAWQTLPTTGLMGGEVARVEAHPSDANSVWIAGKFALYRSNDRGTSWEALAPLELMELGVHPGDPDRLFGIRGDALLRSLDGGRTWTSLIVGGGRVWRFAFDPSDRDVVYAVDTQYPSPPTLYRSEDAGQTWSPRGVFPGSEFVVDPGNGDTLYASSWDGLLRSTDAGASWSEVQGGLPPDGQIRALCFDLVDPSMLYALGEFPGWGQALAVSQDSGASWERHPGFSSWNTKLRPDPAVAGSVFTFESRYFFRYFHAGERAYPLSRLGMPMALHDYFLEDASLSADGRTLYVASSDGWARGFWIFDRRYDDVPASDPRHPSVDALGLAGISAGCSPSLFCPEAVLTRGEAALLIVGSTFHWLWWPPSGTVFSDVGVSTPGAVQIEWLGTGGYSSGCGGGRFCPDEPFTRAQAAVLTLAVRDEPWNLPPPATGTMFDDVPASHYAAAWIEEFARQGYTAGCAPSLFCPEQSVSRGQMAVFLAGVFSLL